MISAAVGIKMKQDAAKQSQFNNLINMILSGKELDLKERKFLADELYRKSSLEQDQFKSLMGLSLSGRELDLAERKFAADQPYKQALTKQANAAALKSLTPDLLDQTFVEGVPGYGNLTLRQYKELSSDDKEYITYVKASQEIGEEPMSYKEFMGSGKKSSLPTTAMGAAIRDYYEENGTMPPPKVMSEWGKMFSEGEKEKTPTPMNWQNATSNLKYRFEPMNPVEGWTMDEGDRLASTMAQGKLAELRKQGVHPLDAVNQAEKYGKDFKAFAEKKFSDAIDNANRLYNGKRLDAEIARIKSEFKQKFNYVPGE